MYEGLRVHISDATAAGSCQACHSQDGKVAVINLGSIQFRLCPSCKKKLDKKLAAHREFG